MKSLRITFIIYVALCLGLVLACENAEQLTGWLAGHYVLEFVLQLLFTLITLGMVYVALKLFVMKKVKKQIEEGGEAVAHRFAAMRIHMLGLPMVVDTVLYYAFLRAAFGYLAIILFIAMLFVWPVGTAKKK